MMKKDVEGVGDARLFVPLVLGYVLMFAGATSMFLANPEYFRTAVGVFCLGVTVAFFSIVMVIATVLRNQQTINDTIKACTWLIEKQSETARHAADGLGTIEDER